MSANRLADATSPYLLQHKDNPVHWHPWGEKALAEARSLDKPILLSVGYAACHWCHVMAHESFEDPATAEVMNRLFVNIKVDREERPDIDQIYMNALHALGEQGGWPLTMFLTPDGEPFWGGTYFPKEARWGRPAFVDILEAVAATYRSERSRIDRNRTGLMQVLKQRAQPAAPLDSAILVLAGDRLLSLFDPEHGGIRGAPKFPQASILDLVWRAGLRTGNPAARETFLHTLRQISNGGIYDHLKGGIARYSVDERWLVPHFEKMLYDNAQYLQHLLTAWLATGEDLFRCRIDETVGWLLDEMRLPEGGFASSLDADSEGEEGRFYVWTAAEVAEVLGADAAFFARFYDISAAGNWEGVTILNRLTGTAASPEEENRLAALRAKLLSRRASRVRPALDDKVLADWNGLLIAALARAGRIVSRESWIAAAEQAFRFIAESMTGGGRLGHAWRAGRLVFPGFASDHAAMMQAAIALAEARPWDAQHYLRIAEGFADALVRHYAAPGGGFYMTADDATDLILRPLSSADEAVPNANSVAADAFARLYLLTGDRRHRDVADAVFHAFAGDVPKNLFATASLLCAFDTRINGRLAVVVAPNGSDPSNLVDSLDRAVDPALTRLVTESTDGLPKDHPAHGKPALDGRPAAYVCREGACSLPAATTTELQRTLGFAV
ncbi:thioredoxin domain-containing protein [Polymorphum gilvum]|uniref:Thioredoxin domain protein n=1 Tax=Polymorphum gilvum (strain LMG 25793 / CGMCC 1.9160 / SL003B-26A1) TaxID=991905 RepID=F2IYK1_POLGS|nr:thioredoxin domain-containing protein [Polymorphum gilvum]ADZ68514.1 Thioredoxin domain protein [Polymorphum gilvum SL003B-26A1]